MKNKSSTILLGAAFGLALATSANAALVAYFPLDGTAGDFANSITATVDDVSHGVTSGTTNSNNTASWVNDATRGSVLHSTNTNRFLAGTQDIDLTKGFSWSLWVRQPSTSTGVIIGTRGGSWHKVVTNGSVDGNGFVDFNLTGAPDIRDGNWHHLAYVGSDNGTGNAATVDVSMYIDGVFYGRDTTAAALTYNGQMEIGGSTRYSEFGDVHLDDIGIFDQRLTEAQIEGLADGSFTPLTVIPEPSAALLGSLGLLALLRRRR